MSTILQSPFQHQQQQQQQILYGGGDNNNISHQTNINNNTSSVVYFTKRKMRREQSVQSVQRILFGEVDHEETLRFVQTERDNQIKNDSDKWNFDFKNQKPYATNDGNYVWKPATPDRDAAIQLQRVAIDKRRQYQNNNDSTTTESCYFQPIEIDDAVVEEKEEDVMVDEEKGNIEKATATPSKQQRRITDYMSTKKRAAMGDFPKKTITGITPVTTTIAVENVLRPAKIPKLNFAS